MKTGQIYAFSAETRHTHYLRAVLRLDDLDLPDGHAMQFVARAWLVQVASEASFDASTIILNGCFVVRHGTLARSGYTAKGSSAVDPATIDFPCWLADYNGSTYLCRGELRYHVSRTVFERWPIRLTARTPDQLDFLLDHYGEYRNAAEAGENPPLSGVPASDIRYNPSRESVLGDAGVSISEPYLSAVSRLGGTGRVVRYLQALNAPGTYVPSA